MENDICDSAEKLVCEPEITRDIFLKLDKTKLHCHKLYKWYKLM